MVIKKTKDDLKLVFTNIFLKASTELQKIALWSEDEKSNWDRLFHKTLKDLNVIYGYFVEFDPNKEEVVYFIESEKNLVEQSTVNFKPTYIPYFPNENPNDIVKSLYNLLLKSEKKFKSVTEAPKLYQHLPIQRKAKDYKLISDKCLNCYVPCDVRSKNDYYVVLFDEIAFYQFAYYHLMNKNIYEHYKSQKKLFLKYLLKFAISIELKIGQNNLMKILKLTDKDRDNWNRDRKAEEHKLPENLVREKIRNSVDANFKNSVWLQNIDFALKNIVDVFIHKYVNKSIYKQSHNTPVDILKHISRFDIDASLKIIDKNKKPILHDVFVFPIYTQTEKVLTTSCVQGDEIDIHSPVLLVLYIKTLSKIIKGKFDEDENSVEGFQLTKEISKLFAGKIIQEDYLKNVVTKKTKHQATRAAISQVMARNGSHNIGSHVLSRLVTKENIQTLEKEISHKGNLINQYQVMNSLEQNKGNSNDRDDYLAYFYSYLKTRMDYLADIATSTPTLENSKLFVQEVMAGFDKNRLLLNRISGIDKFSYRFVIKDCRSCDLVNDLCSCPEITNDSDIPVAIVNDALGQHAFYVILENIIRNTAKHADIQGKKVVFTIEIRESKNDASFYEIQIYDNCSISGNVILENGEIKKYKIIDPEKNNSISKIDKIVFDQNYRLNQSILDESNSLRQGSWGLIEMDISSAYLRKINIEDVDEEKFDIPLSKADEEKFHTGNSREKLLILKAKRKGDFLSYQIHLPKPKEIVIIDAQGDHWKSKFYLNGILNIEKLNRLESNGILCLHNSDELPGGKWKLQFNISYSHQIQILLTPTNQTINNYLPQRLITKEELIHSYTSYHSKGKEESIFWELTKNTRQFIEEAWRCWINKKMFDKKITQINPSVKYSNFIRKTEDSSNPLNIGLDYHADYIKEALVDNDFYQEYDHMTLDLRNRITPYFKGVEKINFNYKELFCFIEGTLNNVLIIDERIQQYFYLNRHKKINLTIGAIAEKSFIYCPDERTVNLNEQSFPKSIRIDLYDKYLREILVKKIQKVKGLDIAVFHLGVIEKILKTENKEKDKIDILQFINEFKDECINLFSYAPFVIITSGRGKPENLPDSIPFLSYSILSQFVIENRFKSLLTQALLSARPKT